MINVLYLVFVLSGAAGLIYESLWTRISGLFVGHDAPRSSFWSSSWAGCW